MPDPTTVGSWSTSWLIELSALTFVTATFVLVIALVVGSVATVIASDGD